MNRTRIAGFCNGRRHGAGPEQVVTNPPNTPPFVASIFSTGNRLTLPAPGAII